MSDPLLVALVVSTQSTRHGPKVWLNVLRGALADGDEVVVTHRDGVRLQIPFTDVGRTPLTAEVCARAHGFPAAGPFTQRGAGAGAYATWDLLEAPGGPPVDLDPECAVAAAIRAAKVAGLNTTGPHLPDGVIALHLQSVMQHAVAHQSGRLSGSDEYKHVSDVLAGYGLSEDADRALLLAAAIREGHKPTPGLRALASLGAGVANALAYRTPMGVSAFGLSMEQGDAFVVAYERGIAVQGEVWRKDLMAKGRALALGWCSKCGQVAALDDRFKCEKCGRRSEEVRVVIPGDRSAAEQELREARSAAR